MNLNLNTCEIEFSDDEAIYIIVLSSKAINTDYSNFMANLARTKRCIIDKVYVLKDALNDVIDNLKREMVKEENKIYKSDICYDINNIEAFKIGLYDKTVNHSACHR